MNRSGRKYVKAAGLSAAICVIGAVIGVLSIKFDLPSTWAKAAFYMCFTGGGIIGVIIALYLYSTPHWERFRTKPLKTKAWTELVQLVFGLLIGGISCYYLINIQKPEKSVWIVILAVIVGIWVMVGQIALKERFLQGLDERERLIYQKAKTVSDSIFSGLFLMGVLGMWGGFGPAARVPVYIPALIFFGLACLADPIRPVIILVQCYMDQRDE